MDEYRLGSVHTKTKGGDVQRSKSGRGKEGGLASVLMFAVRVAKRARPIRQG